MEEEESTTAYEQKMDARNNSVLEYLERLNEEDEYTGQAFSDDITETYKRIVCFCILILI
jgi:predicted RecB family nuclease